MIEIKEEENNYDHLKIESDFVVTHEVDRRN